MHLSPLGIDVLVHVLENSPPALSAGRLCRENGCGLEWSTGGDIARLHPPQGEPVELDIIGDCPQMDSESTSAPDSAAVPFTEGGSEASGEDGGVVPDSPIPPPAEAPPSADDVPPPPDPPADADIRESKEARLRNEAKSLLHRMTHLPKNPFAKYAWMSRLRPRQ